MPRTVTAAETADVLREQLEYLIEHARDEDCLDRYWRVREVLMEAFEESSGTATSTTP